MNRRNVGTVGAGVDDRSRIAGIGDAYEPVRAAFVFRLVGTCVLLNGPFHHAVLAFVLRPVGLDSYGNVDFEESFGCPPIHFGPEFKAFRLWPQCNAGIDGHPVGGAGHMHGGSAAFCLRHSFHMRVIDAFGAEEGIALDVPCVPLVWLVAEKLVMPDSTAVGHQFVSIIKVDQ